MFKNLLLLVCALALFGCSENKSDWVVVQHEEGCSFIPVSVEAVVDVPQDLKIFKSQIQTEKFCKRQKQLNAQFDKMYFAPWNDKFKIDEPSEFSGNFFCENLHKLIASDISVIRDNIRYRQRITQRGIIIRNTMARNWPTESQLFLSIRRPGDSYPFDSNIASLMRLGTPVIIRAISQDGKWGFVGSYAFSGWVSLHDLAYVDNRFIKEFISYGKSVAVKDDDILKYQGKFFNRADIGTILPYDGKCVLCPYKKADGFATLIPCVSSNFRSKPLKFSAENILCICKQFLGQKYGWGGYLNARDCSMLTMDFCTTFGIPLARNGNAQLSQGNHFTLKSNKTDFIIKNGVPFLTLVGRKGHVMLYVGIYENQPVFLHNVWGAPKKSNQKNRYVIGKTVLTTSQFGGDILPDRTVKLEDTITLMRIL